MDPLDHASELLRAGQRDACRPLLEACLADAEASDADRLRATLLRASLHGDDGEMQAAIAAADRAVSMARWLGDGAAEAEALCLRASNALRLGLVRDVVEDSAAALALARALGHGRLQANALRVMSNLALRQGDEDEVRRLLEQSLACAREGRDDESEFWALNNLSNLIGIQAARHADGGDRDAARPLVAELVQVVEQALQVAERTGHWLHRAYAIANLADAYIVDGEHARARELVQEYAGLARQGHAPRLLAYANLDEVRLYRAEGRIDEAIAVIDCDAHRRFLHGNDDLALSSETALYELHKRAGRFEAALRHHEVASRMNEERLTRKAEQQVSVMLARLELEQARAAAERSRLDAELNAQRAQVLEFERERLHRAAHEDPLTGTGNRRAADEALARRLAERPVDGSLCVALVDVDHFKVVNDTHGHAVGDAVLAALGTLMRQGLRSRDEVFRYGGEEFLLVLAGASPEAGQEICERLRQAIERHDWAAIAPGLAVTASFGLARHVSDEAAARLVQRADAALYAAKHDGRNRVALA